MMPMDLTQGVALGCYLIAPSGRISFLPMNFDDRFNETSREELIKKIEHKISTMTKAELESLYYELSTKTQASDL